MKMMLSLLPLILIQASTVWAEAQTTKSCGLTETLSLKERIVECSNRVTASRKGGFKLIARTQAGREVWLEIDTGLLWADMHEKPLKFAEAAKDCGTAEEEKLFGLSFRLPTRDEFKHATQNDLAKSLPNARNAFWSSSLAFSSSTPALPAAYYTFKGYLTGDSQMGFARQHERLSIRCVAGPVAL